MTSSSVTSPFIRVRDAIASVRPWVVSLGTLALVMAFGLAAYALLQDHELRVRHLWNGVTGTSAGIAAHAKNVALAQGAARLAQAMTLLLGLALVLPRRAERAWFRWLGWLGFVVAGVLGAVFMLGLFGCAFQKEWSLWDPACGLDGPCHEAPRPLSPRDWLTSYACLLGMSASAIAATLSMCIGVRWKLWAIRAVVFRFRSARCAPPTAST